ncbi:MAG: hypothetical protein AAF481_02080 [Acidobacteriota bacterium]
MRRRSSLWAYLWAWPTTTVGLLVAALGRCTGGQARSVDGVLEVHGGFATWLLERRWLRATALTLGHVVVGRRGGDLDRWRPHERVHVRQAERWGPLFIPAYLVAGAWAWLRGGHPYRDNPFEREAFAAEEAGEAVWEDPVSRPGE